MPSFEYRFEVVDIRTDSLAYQSAVVRFAEDGWRLVQILVEVPAAVPSEYVLVLERPKTAH